MVGSNTGSACIVMLLPVKQLLSGGSMDATHLQYYTSLVCVAVSYWMIAIWEQIKLYYIDNSHTLVGFVILLCSIQTHFNLLKEK